MSQWLLHMSLASAAKPVEEAWASPLSPHQFAASPAILTELLVGLYEKVDCRKDLGYKQPWRG